MSSHLSTTAPQFSWQTVEFINDWLLYKLLYNGHIFSFPKVSFEERFSCTMITIMNMTIIDDEGGGVT